MKKMQNKALQEMFGLPNEKFQNQFTLESASNFTTQTQKIEPLSINNKSEYKY